MLSAADQIVCQQVEKGGALPIKVLLSYLKELERKTPAMSTKLYVGNLPESVKEKDLRELFSSFGEVEEIAVFKGYGFVVSVG